MDRGGQKERAQVSVPYNQYKILEVELFKLLSCGSQVYQR